MRSSAQRLHEAQLNARVQRVYGEMSERSLGRVLTPEDPMRHLKK